MVVSSRYELDCLIIASVFTFCARLYLQGAQLSFSFNIEHVQLWYDASNVDLRVCVFAQKNRNAIIARSRIQVTLNGQMIANEA